MTDLHRVATGASGHQVIWRVAGAGRPLLLLHGGYGSWNHWSANIDGLAGTARLLVPDIPGLGESDDPEDKASLASIAKPLVAGLDALVGKDAACDVAAFSFGASVAAAIGLQCPGRIGRLILVGAGGLRAPRPPSVALESWREAETEEEVRQLHRRNLERFMFGDPSRIDPEAVEMQRQNTLNARIKSRPLSRLGLLHDYLPHHTGRLDGIWGDLDVTAAGFLHERRALLQATDPRATLSEVAGAGHWVMREATDVVNRLLNNIIHEETDSTGESL